MADSFSATYSVGGDLDRVKNLKQLDNVSNIEVINEVKEVGRIKGFPSKTQPYNFMKKLDIPAIADTYEFEIELPKVDFEILAITLTCSGYGEDDCWDMYYNNNKWFDHWYTSEVKEGLFLGTSTYVYAGYAGDKMKLIFYNTGSAKTVYFGVRTLV